MFYVFLVAVLSFVYYRRPHHFHLFFYRLVNTLRILWKKQLSNDKNEKQTHLERYEDKYIQRYHRLPAVYEFTEEDKNRQKTKFEDLRRIFHENKESTLSNINRSLEEEKENKRQMLELEYEKITMSETRSSFSLSEKQRDEEGEEEVQEDESSSHSISSSNNDADTKSEDAKKCLDENIQRIEEELVECQQTNFDEDENMKLAYKLILDEMHASLINSYVIETTPLGNVSMRYNSARESFEYYSDHNIPYRFLEPIGRKYVITFQCKELFVDMVEELRLSEEKQKKTIAENDANDQKLKLIAEEAAAERTFGNNVIQANTTLPKKNVFAKFKKYNHETNASITNATSLGKNNNSSNSRQNTTPSMPVVSSPSTSSAMLLLKDRSNRYTQIGRFSNFNILKKVDITKVDKRRQMSFADFKRTMGTNATTNCGLKT